MTVPANTEPETNLPQSTNQRVISYAVSSLNNDAAYLVDSYRRMPIVGVYEGLDKVEDYVKLMEKFGKLSDDEPSDAEDWSVE
ncbi:hypothetical protein [Glutamicibacter ardleyensis]|uniref:Uncharacterized protein n=1 Tax=Glutamicibacter ardleyensis TaxID=225894 RepID=A0ABQ2DM88_9MICC|nr:hypothetical protein [Glutamicibacter ardleyensis]GGJ61618.1 hypothetical protein GCM10007173_20550 [Glutamicibacter ardleyensis]